MYKSSLNPYMIWQEMEDIWTKTHQDATEEIKNKLLKLFILHLPDNTGRF